MISRRTELMILATILMMALIFSVIPVFLYTPFQNTYSFDFWSHLIRIEQLNLEHFINYEIDYSNVWRINGGSTYYPPGFSLFLYSIYSLAGSGRASLNFISSFMWVFLCVIVFLVTKKTFNNSRISLLSTFFVATIVSGTNMLGPYYPHPSVFSLIFMLLALLGILQVKDPFLRFVIPTLFLSAIFLSHRPSTLAWVIFLPFIVIVPLLFIKEKRRYVITFSIPILNATFIAIFISIAHWGNMPIDTLMRGGGIFQDRFDILLGFELTNDIFWMLILILSMSLVFAILFNSPRWDGGNYPQMSPPSVPKISRLKYYLLMFFFPLFFISLIGVFILTSGFSNFSNPIALWGSISSGAHTNPLTELIKKIMYIWHLNIIPLLFLPPSIYLLFKSNKRNSPAVFSMTLILSLIFIFIIETYYFEIKIQRIYLYLSPFIFILAAWGLNYFIENYKVTNVIKASICLLLIISVFAVIWAIPEISSPLSDERVDTILWTDQYIDDNDIIGTQSLVVYGRATGQFNYVAQYGLLSIYSPYNIHAYLLNQNTAFVFVQGDQYVEKISKISLYCIYMEEDIAGFMVK